MKAALDRKGVVSGSYSNNYRGVTSIIDIIAKGIGNASNFYGRAGRVLWYAPAAQWAESIIRVQLEYAGCYSSIVVAFISNRLSADSWVL